jgi:glycosyltransferase involved in cell wall biosynthesis
VVLAELLRRGVAVDLYAHRAHVPPPPALLDAGARYFGFDQTGLLDALDRAPGLWGTAVRRSCSPLYRRHWRRTFPPALEARHREDPYDAVLTLGTTRVLELPGVPNVTWLQSPFHTELEAIRRLRRQIVSVSGRTFYLLALANYKYRTAYAPTATEHVIVGSRWAREAIVAEGLPAARTHAVPYPVDLEAFRPDAAGEPDPERPVLLALGRLEPRKRLDLLLDAFALVLAELPAARLQIVGRPGFAPRQLRLLERFPRRDAVEYRDAVPRSAVPTLLRAATVVVQTSENENFGSSVAEALACGTPVVVGPSNGTSDYIDPRSEVFAAYEPGAVARSMLDVIAARQAEPDAVRRSTRAAAEESFAAPAVAGRLLEIVDGAIAAGR